MLARPLDDDNSFTGRARAVGLVGRPDERKPIITQRKKEYSSEG